MIKEFILAIVCCAFIIGCILLAGWPSKNDHVVVRYDCSIAEISPDYPVAVKEACRKRSNK